MSIVKFKANKLTINQTTKEISSQSPTLRSSGYTYGNFWWGTRYYFRSNAAVYAMDHDLDNWSIMSGVTALWASEAKGSLFSKGYKRFGLLQ